MKPIGIVIIICTTLVPAFQLFALPNVTDQIALFSQYLGLAALILMAWGQILSTRLRGLESIFGGLDRIYVLHKWAGIAAMVALLLHDTIDAEMRGLGPETGLNDLAETLGEISLYGLLILVVISVTTFIPYHLWKWTHKAMGALFAMGVFHFVFIMKPFTMGDPAGVYTGVFCAAGLLAYVWTLLPEHMRPSLRYTITSIDRTGGALAIALQPHGKGLRPQPGQFGILRFTGAGLSEPHPFSFSRIDEDGTLRVTIKALGDFTDGLETALGLGRDVRVQGPFGRFRLSGKKPEIWVAGGIGVTPFVTWAKALPESAAPVHLFFCARNRSDAPHLEELQTLSAAKPNLSLHECFSEDGTRLTPDRIVAELGPDLSGVRVSFCGPLALRKALQSGLSRFGVSPRQFHYEEFEFRTGIGLKSLARWVLTKRKTRTRLVPAR